MNPLSFNSIFRIFTLIVTIVGSIGAVVYVLNANQRNESLVLVGLFVAWVVSPFLGLFAAESLSKGRSESTHAKLYLLMMFISISTLAIYSDSLPLPKREPAFYYLVVPAVSWILMLIGQFSFGKKSKKKRKR